MSTIKAVTMTLVSAQGGIFAAFWSLFLVMGKSSGRAQHPTPAPLPAAPNATLY